MAGLDRSACGSWTLLVAAMLILGACSANKPKPLETPTGTSVSAPEPAVVEETPAGESIEASSPEEPSPTADTAVSVPPSEPAEAEQHESDDSSLVLIDTGARDLTERPQSLAEAARAERERRQVAEPTGVVITDKNLDEYATGELTIASPQSPDPGTVGGASPADWLTEMAEREAYWRGQAREIRQAWRDAYDQIPILEKKVFDLRQAFFREDDGFYRDGEIKPAWDRAIEQLEQAHLEVEAKQQELVLFLEEGRAAGALPGWLREGIDLEPQPLVVADPTAEPGEPVIYDQQATDPP